jgi:putative methionine-R-sulfoxide reductase with GAF domain
LQRNHPVRDFDGYAADAGATRSKIVCDVWKKGDACFRYPALGAIN